MQHWDLEYILFIRAFTLDQHTPCQSIVVVVSNLEFHLFISDGKKGNGCCRVSQRSPKADESFKRRKTSYGEMVKHDLISR